MLPKGRPPIRGAAIDEHGACAFAIAIVDPSGKMHHCFDTRQSDRPIGRSLDGASSNFLSLLRDSSIDAGYFAFSDQDDVWYPEKLERALSLLWTAPGNQPAIYCSRTELIDRDGHHVGFSADFKKEPSFRNALVQSIAGGNTMVFNRAARELLKKVLDGNVVIHDRMTYIVVSAAGGTIFYDRRPSVSYRQHGGNLFGANMSFWARARRVKMLFEGPWQEWNPEGRPARYGSSPRPNIACGCSPNVLHNPRGRRLLVHGFLSHLHSLMVTMSQKSSLLQPANSVSQVLIPGHQSGVDLVD